jgi:L-ribulose-5-phosphate 3-epimerase
VKNIFAGHTNSYHGFTLEQALSGISRAGFQYVELSAVRGWTEHVMPDMNDEEKNRARDLLQKYGLTPIGLSGHCNLMDGSRLADFECNIGLAAEFGCKYVISSTGEAHFGKDEVFTDEGLVKNIQKVIPALEKHGLAMVLEIHGEHNTGEKMYALTQKVNSPLVAINYDTANVFYFGGKLPADDVKTCAPGVSYVHLKDKKGPQKEWNFPGVGNGELPLAAFMDYMDAQGYGGPYSVEIEYTQDFCMRDKDRPGDIGVADKEMADSYAYLKKLGRVD